MKRYEPDYGEYPGDPLRMIEAKDGDYVRFDDLPGWVSAKERLPETIYAKDGSVNSVMVYLDPELASGSRYTVANTVWARMNARSEQCWFTHWRELPAPPESPK